MAEYKPCDLVLVRVDDVTCVVEVERDIAKLGDRVDFLIKEVGLVSGFVEDILRCGHMDDTYCFIGSAVTIHKPCSVFRRVWASE